MKKYKSFDELPLTLKVKDLAGILSISLTMAYIVLSDLDRFVLFGWVDHI